MKKGTQRKILSIFLVALLSLTIVMVSITFAACVEITEGERQAQEVTELINAMLTIFDPSDPDSFNPNDRSELDRAIDYAQAALHNLDPLYRTRVPNRGAIDEVITQLFELDANAAAQVVAGLIDNLYQLMPLNYSTAVDTTAERAEFIARLNTAQTAFDALAEFTFRGSNYNIQTRVDDRAVLTVAATQLVEFDVQADNTVSVLAVINLINAPVLQGGITPANRADFMAALNAAQTAYNNLTAALRGRVTNSNQLPILAGQLLAHDRTAARNAAIDLVYGKIAAIPMPLSPNANQQDKDAFATALTQAQNAFNNLEYFEFREEEPIDLRSYVTNSGRIIEAQAQLANWGICSTHTFMQRQTAAALSTAATCTTARTYYYSCECGELDKTQTFSIGNPLGHYFGVDPECGVTQCLHPNCDEVYLCGTCTDCEPCIDCDFGQNPICGYTECSHPNCEEVYECKDCCDCNGCVWGNATITPPTCTEKGFTTETCENCQDTRVINEVPAKGHLFTYRYRGEEARRDAYTFWYSCEHCGEVCGENYFRPCDNPDCPDDGYDCDPICQQCGYSNCTIWNCTLDHAAINAVIADIQVVVTYGVITAENRVAFETALGNAQTNFEALTRYEQALVTNGYRLAEFAAALLDFDRAAAKAAEITRVEGLIDALFVLMPFGVGDDRAEFAAALINAQNAFNGLAAFIFNDESPVDLQGDIDEEDAQIIETAAGQLAAFDALVNIEVQAFLTVGLSRAANIISWQDISFADNYTVSYTYIPYGVDVIHADRTQTVTANSHTFVSHRGFITNVSVRANMPNTVFAGEMPRATLTTALSQTPTERKNETFLLTTANTTLAEAFTYLVEENALGANHNSIMAFLAETALSQVSNHAGVYVRARGLSTASGALRLDVGSDTVVNFNEDGTVYNSYRIVFASATQSHLTVGGGIAWDQAVRRDRVFYNGTTIRRHLHEGNDNNAPVTFNSLQAWQNAQTEEVQLNPGGFIAYVINPAFMSAAGSANMGGAHDLNLGTVNRQEIAINTETNQFTFTFALSGNDGGGRISRWEHRRSGGLTRATYADGYSIALDFTVCSLTLDMVSFRSRSLYGTIAPGLGGIAGYTDTRVDTTATFHFSSDTAITHIITASPTTHNTRPNITATHNLAFWTGEGTTGANATPAMPTWEQLGIRNPINRPTCVVEGTLVTLANGNEVPVETLRVGDLLRVWNFYEGRFDIAPVMVIVREDARIRETIKVNFSDGSYVEFYDSHGFFNTSLMEFSLITAENANGFIGHRFKNHYGKSVVLTSVNILSRSVAVYQPSTAFHMALYTNGMLSVGASIMNHGLVNLFEIEYDTMAFCQINRDYIIAKHGLLTHEEFSQRLPGLPLEFFLAHNGPYLGIAISKGITTWELFTEFFIHNIGFLPIQT